MKHKGRRVLAAALAVLWAIPIWHYAQELGRHYPASPVWSVYNIGALLAGVVLATLYAVAPDSWSTKYHDIGARVATRWSLRRRLVGVVVVASFAVLPVLVTHYETDQLDRAYKVENLGLFEETKVVAVHADGQQPSLFSYDLTLYEPVHGTKTSVLRGSSDWLYRVGEDAAVRVDPNDPSYAVPFGVQGFQWWWLRPVLAWAMWVGLFAAIIGVLCYRKPREKRESDVAAAGNAAVAG
jgi:hypothetical protein